MTEYQVVKAVLDERVDELEKQVDSLVADTTEYASDPQFGIESIVYVALANELRCVRYTLQEMKRLSATLDERVSALAK